MRRTDSFRNVRITSYNVCYTKLLREYIENEKIHILKERNKLFDRIMSEYESLPAPTSCYRFLRLPEGYDDIELEYMAVEKGVQILSANRFYVGSRPEKPTIRLAVSAPNTIVITSYSIHYTKLYEL